MFGGIWHHVHGQRWAGAIWRDNLSDEERRITGEPVENLAADEFVEQQLGGIDPARLLPDDHPRHN